MNDMSSSMPNPILLALLCISCCHGASIGGTCYQVRTDLIADYPPGFVAGYVTAKSAELGFGVAYLNGWKVVLLTEPMTYGERSYNGLCQVSYNSIFVRVKDNMNNLSDTALLHELGHAYLHWATGNADPEHQLTPFWERLEVLQ